MLRELAHTSRAETNTPDVRAERCVHSLIEQANCRACVDACPTGAWVINDEMLGIDPERCDACDLCVAACPEAAIVQRFRPEVRKTPHGNVAFACCEHAQIAGADVPRMPCLHAIGIADLLRLAHDQAKFIITASSDCNTCSRGRGERFEERLRAVNALSTNRGLTTIAHRSPDTKTWLDTWRQVDAMAKQNRVSRRGFFRSAVQEPSRRIEEVLDRAEGRFVPPGSLLPSRSPRDAVPFAPVIDPERCNGCDACARLCPHKAIRIEMEDACPRAYVIAADQCSGCGICMDLCEQDAVSLLCWQPAVRASIPLENHTCHACGVTYHLPYLEKDEDSSDRLCPICRRTNHHRHLYQVLD